eukprot:scaffold81058_cov46-Phaeocystis_antarctica.AAC.2
MASRASFYIIAPLRPPGRASAERGRTKFLGGRSLQSHSSTGPAQSSARSRTSQGACAQWQWRRG